MNFRTAPGLVLFTMPRPANFATMFGPDGESLPYCDEMSTFAKHENTWAFKYDRVLKDADYFTFASADVEVIGKAVGTAIVVLSDRAAVARGGRGEPIKLEDQRQKKTDSASHQTTVAPITSSSHLPKVSVVTCTYNRPDFLREAIICLRRQTDHDWEHLIYDDASTNPEVSKVLDWARRDPRVRTWRRPDNVDRPAKLWNFMIDRAHGRYLSVLDDDNEKLPDFIERLSGDLDNDPSLDLVTCGIVSINHLGHRHYTSPNMDTRIDILNERNPCDGGAMMYRASAFQRVGYFSETQRTNEDWDWLRRAVRVLKIKNLCDPLVTYRAHAYNRMIRCKELGHDSDVALLTNRINTSTITTRIIRPTGDLTQSQMDVVSAVERAICSIPWVIPSDDASTYVTVVIAPFAMDPATLETALSESPRVLSVHMEDPSALNANMERIEAMHRACHETWVCTNDAATAEAYRKRVGDHVIICPLLGAEDSLPDEINRDIDVTLCGYPYPSRKALISALLPLIRNRRVLLIGDGWNAYGDHVEAIGTVPAAEAHRLLRRSRTAICSHRQFTDAFHGFRPPQSVNRGFVEGYCGARTFVDRSRNDHPFDDGDVVWYDKPEDLAMALNAYLDGPRDWHADQFAEKCRAFTYRSRIERILNCLRSPRYLAAIP